MRWLLALVVALAGCTGSEGDQDRLPDDAGASDIHETMMAGNGTAPAHGAADLDGAAGAVVPGPPGPTGPDAADEAATRAPAPPDAAEPRAESVPGSPPSAPADDRIGPQGPQDVPTDPPPHPSPTEPLLEPLDLDVLAGRLG